MLRLVVLIGVLACGVAGAVGASVRASSPPGATARCSDGTFSYSTHHSGTCSHHGGVAAWLDGSTAAAAGPTGPATSSPSVSLGSTRYLGKRTRRSGCRLGALPDRRCSPGAVYSGLTTSALCSPFFHTSSIRAVSESTRHEVEAEYGLPARSYGRTLEIDHIVPLELGGSNDIQNLFPEEAVLPGGAPGYHAKDRLENETHARVCAGALTLAAAQRAIATDWERLYERLFSAAAR